MKGVFFGRHPIISVCYFGVVLLLTVLSLHPIFLIMSFVAAVGYRLLDGGIKQLGVLLWMTPLFLFIIIINPLFVNNGETVIFSWSGVSISSEALIYGICNAVLLATVTLWIVLCVNVLTAEKIRYLIGKRLPSVCLLLGMLLRFFPLFRQKAEEIKSAQYGIGRMQPKASAFRRAKQAATLLTVLTPWALEQSIHTSNVLAARGYRSPSFTCYRKYRFSVSDTVVLAVVLICGITAAVGILIGGQVRFYPTVSFSFNIFTTVALAAQFILLLLPFAEMISEEILWKYCR